MLMEPLWRWCEAWMAAMRDGGRASETFGDSGGDRGYRGYFGDAGGWFGTSGYFDVRTESRFDEGREVSIVN